MNVKSSRMFYKLHMRACVYMCLVIQLLHYLPISTWQQFYSHFVVSSFKIIIWPTSMTSDFKLQTFFGLPKHDILSK